MGSVVCKAKKTGTPRFFSCWVLVGKRQIDLTASQATPVPLDSGNHDLLWELKGEIGEGVAIEVWVDGSLAAQLPETLIAKGNRVGSGTRPGTPGYQPLPFTVGGQNA